jgi:3-oxoacyl-[acyl-carrier protein] reductase
MRSIKDMSILVTGGGSGIGEGCARHFASRGAKVTISGRREAKVRDVAQSIGPNCAYVVGDVTSDADRKKMIATAVEHGRGLDALVNNAGNTLLGSFADFTEEQLLDLFNSNVVAPMLLTALAIPHLERSQGAVIFVGSVHTRLALTGRIPYAATKGAIQVLTRTLAAELGPKKIRSNCVIPGAVPTEINVRAGAKDLGKDFFESLSAMHPLGRIGKPEEIGEAMEYLICAEWTTGAIVDVDGGMGLGSAKLK